MDTIVDEGLVENGILLDEYLDGFLRRDAAQECAHCVQLRIGKADHLVVDARVDRRWPFVRCGDFLYILLTFVLEPFDVLSAHGVRVDNEARLLVYGLPWASPFGSAEVLKAPASNVPLVALLRVRETPLKFLRWREVLQLTLERVDDRYLQVLGILASHLELLQILRELG